MNGFNEFRLILNPGGCAVYLLPVKEEQTFTLIFPARKPSGGLYEDYCGKGRLNVVISSGSKETNFTCFDDPTSCDASACVGNFEPVLTEDFDEIQLSLCVPETDSNTASIWELNVSKVRYKQPKIMIYKEFIISRGMIPVQSKASSQILQSKD